MQPVIKHLPLMEARLIDHASGVQNADQAAGGRLVDRLGWLVIRTFIWGVLSGAAVATGIFLYLS